MHSFLTGMRQQGMTLTELMVAMLLGLLLIAAIIQIFTGSKQTYRTTEASSVVQENGRFADHFLSHDLRMAGFFGCLGESELEFTNNVDASSNKYPSDVSEAVNISVDNELRAYAIGSSLPSDLGALGLAMGSNEGDVMPNTEAVLIRRANQCPGGRVVPPLMGDQSANIKIADAESCGLEQNTVALITDCQTADAFGITNNPVSGTKDTLTHSSALNLSNNLSTTYGEDAWVYSMYAAVYYVGRDRAGEPSLYRRMLGKGGTMQAEELVGDIEDLAFEFGIDQDEDFVADTYRDTSELSMADWARVVAVRYSFVARSHEGNVIDNVQEYRFDGQDMEGTDRRLRHVFTKTVSLRNRLK
ncbi:PilW family protein [Ectothiorhodospira mobilis]|uniref:PilW family protein n=1 Tax=Ectothiorhodospira mobilis TaxID=195064 RepID=UPI001906479F|nr:PilW family protein [Ectothiorhodospira mobilis]